VIILYQTSSIPCIQVDALHYNTCSISDVQQSRIMLKQISDRGRQMAASVFYEANQLKPRTCFYNRPLHVLLSTDESTNLALGQVNKHYTFQVVLNIFTFFVRVFLSVSFPYFIDWHPRVCPTLTTFDPTAGIYENASKFTVPVEIITASCLCIV